MMPIFYGWECKGASLDTELPLQLVDAAWLIMSRPLQDAKRGQSARKMRLWYLFRPRLTASHREGIFADLAHLYDFGPHAKQ